MNKKELGLVALLLTVAITIVAFALWTQTWNDSPSLQDLEAFQVACSEWRTENGYDYHPVFPSGGCYGKNAEGQIFTFTIQEWNDTGNH